MIHRGDIRWLRFAAPDKRRPVLILGREDGWRLRSDFHDGTVDPRVVVRQVQAKKTDGALDIDVVIADWLVKIENPFPSTPTREVVLQ